MKHEASLIIPCCYEDEESFICRAKTLSLQIELLPLNVQPIIIQQIRHSSDKWFDAFFSGDRPDIIFDTYNYSGPFNKSWLYNIGVNSSRTRFVILGETDIIDQYFNSWTELFNRINKIENYTWEFGWSYLTYLNKEKTESVREINGPSPGGPEGGRVIFDKSFYQSIGGANEFIQGLGGIDNELALRAKHASGNYEYRIGNLYHLWHPHSSWKGDDDPEKHRLREMNKKIYAWTKKHPQLCIDKLKRYDNGGKLPLSETQKSFYKELN